MSKRYWMGEVKDRDDFDAPINKVFIDGRTQMGPWAIMSRASYSRYGVGQFGPGFGQKYVQQPDGRWLKVEG